jgi:hypothetical protein
MRKCAKDGVRLRAAWLLIAGAGLTGCASPPSVIPLIQVANQAIAQERQLLDVDAKRMSQSLQEQRDSLASAFEADLRAQQTLSAAWVTEGVQVYVAAREQLLRQQLDLQRAADLRRDNMAAAQEVLARAVGLVQKQDQLFEVVPDLRRWVEKQMKEGVR